MPNQSSPRNSSEMPVAAGSTPELRLLDIVFVALFVQLVLLILASLVLQRGPTFVGRAEGGFSMDFGDFYLAAMYYTHHLNPYSTGGFVWPPFAILIGLLFKSMPWAIARYWWLAINLSCLLAALIAFSRQINLGRRNTTLVLMIAALSYPVHFLIERGHVDGLMLACLVFAFRARHWALRSLLFGMSIAIKLYSGLLLVVLARRKRWKFMFGAIAACALLQLPWLNLALSYPMVLSRRTSQWIMVENITPAPLFYSALGSFGPLWKLMFFLFWLLTFGWTLLQFNTEQNDSADWVLFAPWMMSMPLVVYPYTAVLTLPLLAYQAKRMQGRRWSAPEWLFVAGFVLVGTQQTAISDFLASVPNYATLVYRLNSLGSAILMVSCCMLVSKPSGYGAAKSQEDQIVTSAA